MWAQSVSWAQQIQDMGFPVRLGWSQAGQGGSGTPQLLPLVPQGDGGLGSRDACSGEQRGMQVPGHAPDRRGARELASSTRSLGRARQGTQQCCTLTLVFVVSGRSEVVFGVPSGRQKSHTGSAERGDRTRQEASGGSLLVTEGVKVCAPQKDGISQRRDFTVVSLWAPWQAAQGPPHVNIQDPLWAERGHPPRTVGTSQSPAHPLL